MIKYDPDAIAKTRVEEDDTTALITVELLDGHCVSVAIDKNYFNCENVIRSLQSLVKLIKHSHPSELDRMARYDNFDHSMERDSAGMYVLYEDAAEMYKRIKKGV